MSKDGDVLSDGGVSGEIRVLLGTSDRSFSDATEFIVEIGGQEVYAHTPSVSFCDVDGMCRRLEKNIYLTVA